MSDVARHIDLADQLATSLSPTNRELLRLAVKIAAAHHVRIFLVGGPVRDLILRRPITDLDLVVEGDAWPIADAFSVETSGTITRHAAFRTAVVEIAVGGEQQAIDFVTARRETYSAPAALPVITPSNMRDDLARRDFTINALALELVPNGTGELLDPFAGMADMIARVIRVLHDCSFFDDPTRILRAARFASRLGFVVETATRTQLEAALAATMIARTSPQRILNELWLALDEPRPEDTLQLLHELGAFEQLNLVWSDEWSGQFSAARTSHWADVSLHHLYFGLLVWPMDSRHRAAFRVRYNLPTGERRLLDELPENVPSELEQRELSSYELEQRLQHFSLTAIRTLQLVAPATAAQHLERYVHQIRSLPPLLSGDDLRAHGIPPGPHYRTILGELRKAQLAGKVTTRDAALRWLNQRTI